MPAFPGLPSQIAPRSRSLVCPFWPAFSHEPTRRSIQSFIL
ncbi:hypothetical protein IB211_00390c [Intestinimonas butyriciproducens]|uniref:Uncharacterized protein n=1 Tax=Intestinimonas butyriciproducens TaxID=1297617 RepID=A0A0S2W0B3_9FIRM|nr:hypothetical protein IB211_00390c [Intestinimonas butyriciproducens]